MAPTGHGTPDLPCRIVAEYSEHHGVLPLGGDLWHAIETRLAPRAICGTIIGYGARLKDWAETPEDDRCAYCLQRLSGDDQA